jgi:hypothetical protein
VTRTELFSAVALALQQGAPWLDTGLAGLPKTAKVKIDEHMTGSLTGIKTAVKT